MSLFNENVAEIVASGVITVGTSAAQLDDVSCKYAVLQPDSDNTDEIYIAANSGTAVTTANAGVRLAATSAPFVHPGNNLSQLQAISGATGQKLRYIAYK